MSTSPVAGTNSVGRLQGRLALAAVFMSVLIIVGSAWLVGDVTTTFLTKFVSPLQNAEPLLRLDYVVFGLPGMLLGLAGFLLLIMLGFLAQPLRVRRARVNRIADRLVKSMVVGVGLMTLGPLVVGPAVHSYAKACGYQSCDRLFELGVMRYERVLVSDSRLCVSKDHLEAALQRMPD